MTLTTTELLYNDLEHVMTLTITVLLYNDLKHHTMALTTTRLP